MQIQVGKPAVSTVVLSAIALAVIIVSMHFVFAGFDLPTLRQEGAARNLSFTIALLALISMLNIGARQLKLWKNSAR